MSELDLRPNLSNHDDLYERLIALHEGLSEEESRKANAKLILLLANHIGETAVIEDAIARVRRSMRGREG